MHARWHRPVLTLLTSLAVATTTLAIGSPPAAADTAETPAVSRLVAGAPHTSATVDVRINEVESNGGTPGDWVELLNTGAAPVDVSGWVFKDNDDTHAYAIPAGTSIAPGGYLMLDEAQFDFGLGAAETARIFAADGTTLVDSYTWTAHANPTYGRCPDGTGDFRTQTTATRGAANDCSSPLTINEVESNGDPVGDWIELANPSAAPVDASGLRLKDADDAHELLDIPAGTTIPAGGTFAIYVDPPWGLGGADTARLFEADGTTLVDSYSWTTHAATTYGRCPSGVGEFTTTAAPTMGAVNDCGIAGVDDVKVNEVESDGDVTDWIELTNVGDAAVDVSGWVLKDNDDTSSYVVAPGTTLTVDGFVAFDVSDAFGLGGADVARVYAADGVTLVDSFAYEGHAATTYGRCPDGTGSFAVTLAATKGAANSCATAESTVKLNEVESSDGTPGDWLELVNTGVAPADVSGWVVRDGADDAPYTVPAATTIPAGGYLVLEEAELGFGLGGADSARLFAADGITLIDSHTWSEHATTTYGRCPDAIGPFATTLTATKGAANDCEVVVPTTVIWNEVESNGGTPGDWAELVNTGEAPVDISGLKFKDADDSHAFYTIPSGTTIAAGGYYVLEEAQFGFGLGTPDSVRLFAADGTTVVDSYSWTPHATTSYGRCPDATGAFTTTTSTTKGAANDCSSPVRINEVESNDGAPGDWVELRNNGASPADLSGWVIKDANDSPSVTLPAGTTVAPGGYLAIDTEPTFGLGGGDSARLYAADGTTLVDSYTWAGHATTTYGRCPDGTGAFATTQTPTKGAANVCPGDLVTTPWPGGTEVATADAAGVLGSDISGLAYEGSGSAEPGVLWAVNNGTGQLLRLLESGDTWVSDTADGWAAGKALTYADGTGVPDTEGVTLTGAGPEGGVYVATERNNSASSVSRPSVLRYDVSGSAATLTATHEWNLTADLPPVAANSGLEGIAWVPDGYLTGSGFVDEVTDAAYDPTDYPGHGTGLFFVGLEGNGTIYAYALDHTDGSATKVATIASGFPGVMDVVWDPEISSLWAVCDDTCAGRTTILEVQTEAGPDQGSFVITDAHERPAGMPNLNNEGFAITPTAECAGGLKPVFWADDGNTGSHALRSGTLECSGPTEPTDPTITAAVSSAVAQTAFGWFRAPVKVTFTCTEGSAPLTAPCPAPVVLASAGADQSVSRTIEATDGGTATATVADIDIDRAVPVVRISGVKAGAVYAGSAPKAACVGSDTLSGLASCALVTTRKGDRTTVTATATDRAGNVSTARASYRTLAFFLSGATYDDGAFLVKQRQRYQLVALVDGGPAPRWLEAVRKGRKPNELGGVMKRAGRQAGLTKYTASVRIGTDLGKAKYSFGIKVGKRINLVTFAKS